MVSRISSPDSADAGIPHQMKEFIARFARFIRSGVSNCRTDPPLPTTRVRGPQTVLCLAGLPGRAMSGSRGSSISRGSFGLPVRPVHAVRLVHAVRAVRFVRFTRFVRPFQFGSPVLVRGRDSSGSGSGRFGSCGSGSVRVHPALANHRPTARR